MVLDVKPDALCPTYLKDVQARRATTNLICIKKKLVINMNWTILSTMCVDQAAEKLFKTEKLIFSPTDTLVLQKGKHLF